MIMTSLSLSAANEMAPEAGKGSEGVVTLLRSSNTSEEA